MRELTERETEVLSLVGRGFTRKQVANALFVSKGTIDNHMESIFNKLSAFNARQALYNYKNGLKGMG